MHVEFRPPAVGTSQVPIKITGPGTLQLDDVGLQVVGAEVANRGRSLVFLLAVLVFAVVMVTLQRTLSLSSTVSGAIAGVAGALVLIPVLRAPAKAGAPIEICFPWENVKKITYDGASQCLVVVIKGMKPNGGLFVAQPPGSELQRQLEARLAARS